jgi:hypothetical protein
MEMVFHSFFFRKFHANGIFAISPSLFRLYSRRRRRFLLRSVFYYGFLYCYRRVHIAGVHIQRVILYAWQPARCFTAMAYRISNFPAISASAPIDTQHINNNRVFKTTCFQHQRAL